MLLSDLKPGDRAQVTEIKKSERNCRKLYEIGLMPGSIIEFVSRHPFKGPLVFRLGNSEFALDQNLANLIRVDRY